eukprot:gnl/TRDRNA2_/TRDRNA2_165184_c0_seq1.p1 gnl/TRDRNA2_/TRDRNA2_165184_c0~~gnl/TRDRNA2_/TRDRNA2_165184_c0_seq1.p1  ORF type:complete len:396 (+),score=54.77 gnl/TRDRNA2_/TRDRNA2_165184_c0_seq1:88-1188(+)
MQSEEIVGSERWLQLRDEDEQWVCVEMEHSDFGVLVEPLPTHDAPPSLEVRSAHTCAVAAVAALERSKGFQDDEAHKGSQADRCVILLYNEVRLFYEALSSTGCPTLPSPSAQHFNIQIDKHLVDQLLDRGFLVWDTADPSFIAEYISQMKTLDESGDLKPADAKGQRTVGQRGDRILWVDEYLARARFEAPAVATVIAYLKGVAHALNPALSGFHRTRMAAGDPAHMTPPALPAQLDAVLTVPTKAMLASYPGRGARYKLHQDNRYMPTSGKRLNPRELTVIAYANPGDWDLDRDGGALRLYPHSSHLLTEAELQKEIEKKTIEPTTVSPLGGRIVIFFSSLWHEVMPAYRERRAVTLWIFRPTG